MGCKDNDKDKKLELLIKESMKIEERPSAALNNQLKARLYEQEAVNRSKEGNYIISLWYMPMVMNFLMFSILAVLALVLISNTYLAGFVAIGCGYMSIIGIVVTILGLKRTNMKSDITLYIRKRRRIGYEG